MGNFSRNTFDQTKNYVAVRLEQGVPLVDADWNELEDVTRFEIYEALRCAAPSVVGRGGLDVAVAGPNDIVVSPGRAVVDGRPIRLWGALQYSTQRYANAATAAADGVPQATPLTQPAGPRNDSVYLDSFEREVTRADDPNLINGAIGLETSTRLKREIVLRVAQGSASPPFPPPGHVHLAIALISRNAGPITPPQIQDVKPYPLPLGARDAAFAPFLLPVSSNGSAQPTFSIDTGAFPYRVIARKPSAQLSAMGDMQIHVPDGARLTQIRIRGTSAGAFSWQFFRSLNDGSATTAITNEFFATPGPFDRILPIPVGEPLVDSSLNYYHVTVFTSTTPGVSDVYGVSVRFVP